MSAYVHKDNLRGAHSSTINALSFSSDGKYLASGADDSTLIIWSLTAGRFIFRLRFTSPIHIVLWHPIYPETILVGCRDGVICQAKNFQLCDYSKTLIHVGATGTVHCMAYSKAQGYLAIGHGDEVHITKENLADGETGSGCYDAVVKLPNPTQLGIDSNSGTDERVRPRGVHFNGRGTQIIVSYLNHGICCFGIDGSSLWHITPPDTHPYIGVSALSPDGNHFVVHNLRDGVDLYKVSDQRHVRSFKLESEQEDSIIAVDFIHQGAAVASGSLTGNIYIWETTTGDIFQALNCNQGQSTTATQVLTACQLRHESWIALAVDDIRGPSIQLWRAKIEKLPPNAENVFVEIVQSLQSGTVWTDAYAQRRALLFLTSLAGIIVISGLGWWQRDSLINASCRFGAASYSAIRLSMQLFWLLMALVREKSSVLLVMGWKKLVKKWDEVYVSVDSYTVDALRNYLRLPPLEDM